MARRTVILAAAAIGLCVGPASADEDDWGGLYKAIDAKDGSVDRLSIVPDDQRSFIVRMTSTGISLCADSSDNTAGWITATGRLTDDGMVRENAMLTCAATGESRPIADSTYKLDDDTEILTINTPDDGRAIYYHRLSDD